MKFEDKIREILDRDLLLETKIARIVDAHEDALSEVWDEGYWEGQESCDESPW